jgi:hypothetical protein
MTWLTWRQLRLQVALVYGAVAAGVTVLALTGPRLADLAKLEGNLFDKLTPNDQRTFFVSLIAVAATPALLGAFWGAPLLARELETGTHRLVWNQTVTRTRWLMVKLGLTMAAAAAAVGVLTLAVSWWSEPIDGATSRGSGSLPARLTPVAFAMRGAVPVAYALFAISLGVVLGAAIRRSVPAMAATLALYAAVQVAFPLWVRPHLAAPVRETVSISIERMEGIGFQDFAGPMFLTLNTGGVGDWVLSNETVGPDGVAGPLPQWMHDCLPRPGDAPTRVEGRDRIGACLERLSKEGYRQRLVYHRASSFWTLQWRETAVYLVMAGLLCAAAVRLTRRA